jgi:hypothetical protein
VEEDPGAEHPAWRRVAQLLGILDVSDPRLHNLRAPERA